MSARQTVDSFWARVDIRGLNECWPWLGAQNNSGYGTASWHGTVYVSHRIAAWILGFVEQPEAPADRLGSGFILHSCDNPPCCNPTHWEIGTYTQNQLDAYARKRKAPLRGGATHPIAKLTPNQVRNIRQNYDAGGVRQVDLASQHGVSQRTISLVTRRESYQWIS